MKRVLIIPVVVCAVLSFASADFRTDALNLHNSYRAKHHSPPLALSEELNNFAQQWAQTMANSNNMAHSNGKYGENVYMSSNTKLTDSEAAMEATKLWYDEISKYDYRSAMFASSTGHFTQVVWKASSHLGVGVARSNRGVFVCANYNPRGNMIGQFKQNVLAPRRKQ